MSDLSLRSNSCIELSEIRKLDNLLKQCESVSHEDISYETEQFEIYDYLENKRKYSSTGLLSKLTNGKKMHRFYLKDIDCSSGGVGSSDKSMISHQQKSFEKESDPFVFKDLTSGLKKRNNKYEYLNPEKIDSDTQSCSNLNSTCKQNSAASNRRNFTSPTGRIFSKSHEEDNPLSLDAKRKQLDNNRKRRKVHTCDNFDKVPQSGNQIPNSLIAFNDPVPATTTQAQSHPFGIINQSESFPNNDGNKMDCGWTSHQHDDNELEYRKITINELPSQIINVSNVKLAHSGSDTLKSFDTRSEKSLSHVNSSKSRTLFSRKMSHAGKHGENYDSTARESLLPAKLELLDLKLLEPVETVCNFSI